MVCGFIWDDDAHVTTNPYVIGQLRLREIWTTSEWRPFVLVIAAFRFEHAVWGLAPLPYHLVNVLEHAACGVLLWRVLRRLRVPGAWLGAALWALHPLQVESVAWVSEMKNTQSGIFYLLTILFYVRWLQRSETQNKGKGDWNYGLTLLFAALAMASKSATAVIPVVLALCAWWLQGRWDWRNLMKLAPVFLMSVISIGITLWPDASNATATADPQAARSWPSGWQRRVT